jgi:hypothetical protein
MIGMEPMDASENRQIARDSLFVLADLRVDGLPEEHRIKVRNLSDGGMMGEGAVRVRRGSSVEVNIRNLGWIRGNVAWVQDTRFGVAFIDPIDPRLARTRLSSEEDAAPHFTRAPQTASPGTVRKV